MIFLSNKSNLNNTEKMSASKSFLKGAAILSISMVIVKLLGAVYKIAMTNLYSMFGDEYAGLGVGLFNNAYELYIPLFTSFAKVNVPLTIYCSYCRFPNCSFKTNF